MSEAINVALIQGRHEIVWQDATVSEAVWESIPNDRVLDTVSYTHLTLPTSSQV